MSNTKTDLATMRVAVEREAFAAARGYVAENPLRACPFCGGRSEVKDVGYICHAGTWVDWILVGCIADDCGSWLSASTPAAVVGKWNRRADEGKPRAPHEPCGADDSRMQ